MDRFEGGTKGVHGFQNGMVTEREGKGKKQLRIVKQSLRQ